MTAAGFFVLAKSCARRAYLAAQLSLLLACAHGPSPAATEAPPPRPPLAASSIGAVLAHRGELQLSDEQVEKLAQMDRELAKANEAIRTEGKSAGKPGQSGARESRSGNASDSRPPRDPTAGGGMGGGRGMGRGGGHHRGMIPGTASDGEKRTDPQEKMDDNDTKAYLDAEPVLTEAQRPRAREIAEEYREQVYEWRSAKASGAGK